MSTSHKRALKFDAQTSPLLNFLLLSQLRHNIGIWRRDRLAQWENVCFVIQRSKVDSGRSWEKMYMQLVACTRGNKKRATSTSQKFFRLITMNWSTTPSTGHNNTKRILHSTHWVKGKRSPENWSHDVWQMLSYTLLCNTTTNSATHRNSTSLQD